MGSEDTRTAPRLGQSETLGRTQTVEGETPRRGSLIGRYVVLGVLGRGGMGVVLSAFDPQLDRRVALKLVRGDSRSASWPRARARLLREAKAMAKLRHRNVAIVHDAGQTEAGAAYVAMELVDGEDMRAWLRTQPGWRAVVQTFAAAGLGLSAAHAAGLVHRDFKPENVLLSKSGEVVVTDFGLAAPARDATPSPASTDTTLQLQTLTRTGDIVGTPAYMAPEQFRRGDVDHRADVFAFCVALHEALYGQPPFHGDTVAARCDAVLREDIRPIPSTDVPSWLREVVHRGLRSDPDQRWPAMAPLLAALKRASPRRTWPVALAAAVGIAGAVAVVHSATSDPECALNRHSLVGIWDRSRRQALIDNFSSTVPAYGADAATRAVAELDAYAQSWHTVARNACSELAQEEPSKRDFARMSCLEGRRAGLRAAVDFLLEQEPEVPGVAPRVLDRLRPPQACANPSFLENQPAPPNDPTARRTFALAEATARRGEVLVEAGQLDRARQALQELKDLAEEIDADAVRIEAAVLQAGLHEARGEYQDSVESLTRAVEVALSSGNDAWLPTLFNELLYLEGYVLAKHDAGRRWARLSAAAIVRGDDPSRLEAQRLAGLASVSTSERDTAEAVRLVQEAIAAADDSPAYDWSFRDALHQNLAASLAMDDRLSESRAAFETLLASRQEHYGRSHPEVARAYKNLAQVSLNMDDLTGAEAYATHAAELFRSVGVGLPEQIAVLSVLSTVYRHRGQHAAALEAAQQVRDLAVSIYGEDNPRSLDAADDLARALRNMGRTDDATRLHARILAAHEANDAERRLAESLPNAGETDLARGEPELARARFERAIALHKKIAGEDTTRIGWALRGMGRAYVAMGAIDEGVAAFDQALAIAGKEDSVTRHEVRALRAHAFIEMGAHDRAIAELRDLLPHLDADAVVLSMEARLWLAEALLAEGVDEQQAAELLDVVDAATFDGPVRGTLAKASAALRDRLPAR